MSAYNGMGIIVFSFFSQWRPKIPPKRPPTTAWDHIKSLFEKKCIKTCIKSIVKIKGKSMYNIHVYMYMYNMYIHVIYIHTMYINV